MKTIMAALIITLAGCAGVRVEGIPGPVESVECNQHLEDSTKFVCHIVGEYPAGMVR